MGEGGRDEAESEEELIRSYLSYIIGYASRLNISGLSIEVDDLVQVGVMALLEAWARFDKSKKNKFWSFAQFRVRGAMLDEIREVGFVPRRQVELGKRVVAFEEDYFKRHGYVPDFTMTAAELGLTPKQQQHLLVYSGFQPTLSADIPPGDDEFDTLVEMTADERTLPDNDAQIEQIGRLLRAYIQKLPPIQRDVITKYYFKGDLLREIGAPRGITESAVAHSHFVGLRRLKELLLKTYKKEDLL